MSEVTLTAMGRTILRPDDTTRIPRTYRLDDGDRPRALSEDTRLQSDPSMAKQPSLSSLSTISREDMSSSTSSIKPEREPLSAEETIERARRAVEEGRNDTQHALAGNEAVSEAVRPRLTIDLGHANIARIPEPVVDLIKNEVERLSLSHNQIWHIPYRFAECEQLRYLNIRTNVFREFPKAVYKLPLLEILDISRNKLRRVPEEISQLTSLRVFSLMYNKVEELPYSLCDMSKLQILKVAENPLRFRLRRAIDQREQETTSSNLTDNEKEIATTWEIKRFLRDERGGKPLMTPVEAESGGETSESTIDTPKPLKRVLSSRFPVIPSTSASGSESASELTIKSPAQQRPPPIPTRSHYRIQSGQNGGLLRRPGVSPLSSGNERNRSNSEGVLQATALTRNKRMAILRKERTDLDTVQEGPSNRLSHLRGHSYASALRNRIGESSTEDDTSSSPESPKDGRKTRLAYIRRLSSLPEHKQDHDYWSPLVDGAKGILYALYQLHPHISSLMNVVKAKEPKRSSLEIIFHTASTHIDQLNQVLESADVVDEEDEGSVENSEYAIRAACMRCIKSYTALCLQLQQYVPKMVSGSDARYVRTLMLLLYGSIIEMKNACISLGVDVNAKVQGVQHDDGAFQAHIGQTIRPAKAAQERSLSRPAPRLRSDTAIQHPTLNTLAAQSANTSTQPTPTYPTALNMTGSTMNGVTSTYAPSSFGGSTLTNRSRSNSRTAALSSLSSSVASTPRSGDSFVGAPAGTALNRINTVTGISEVEEERIFEQIFLSLSSAYEVALQSLPIVRRQFTRSLEAAEQNRLPKEVRDMWSNLVYRCNTCMEMSEGLHNRLINMKVKDPVSGRNQREFWQLCKTFMQSFVDLAIDMRDARTLQMLPTEAIIVLRPVQKASREAGRLIDASPWGYLADTNAGVPVAPMQQYSGGNVYSNAIQNMSYPTAGQPPANGISPVSVPLPATPLSAALGPAAQATIPSTPASAYGDQFFAGNVFQRADSLLNMTQVGAMPLYSRRQ